MMTQTEKTEIMKKILKWLLSLEKTETNGATTSQAQHHIEWEICEGGAAPNTCKKYLEDLHKGGLIEYKHPFWRISKFGKEWLERHGA
jgi:hypothetical protein